MVHVIVRHTVDDFARWKPYFDSDAGTRQAAGSQGGMLLRGAGNPNEVVIFFRWDSLENVQEFIHAPALAEVMQQAGVVGMPDFTFLEKVEEFTA
ncbi:MAG: antibiotic biosynthesis monooxygenase [Anaerolineae bacterium]|nr:antibiotic biosynthesis monooxygenase [Anaerolineae bacterium]